MAKILGGSGGKDNVFPQFKGINRGQYRLFEARVRDYIQNNGTVKIEWKFIYGKGGTRPTKIHYDIFQNGKKVLGDIFNNWGELSAIFDKYCTKKDRKYGRQVGLACREPPEYSPDEEILNTEELKGNKIVIYTQQKTGVENQCRYTLHYKNKEWLIDRKEVYDEFEKKWLKKIL